ncbi:hypothetical protein ACHWQZ_G019237 [Mnemiopsis leidyi]
MPDESKQISQLKTGSSTQTRDDELDPYLGTKSYSLCCFHTTEGIPIRGDHRRRAMQRPTTSAFTNQILDK